MARAGTVPVFTDRRLSKEEPGYTPAASPRLRRRLSPWPPEPTVVIGSEVAHPRVRWTRTAPSPDPSGSSWWDILGGFTHRFLAYSFSSCSPGRRHLTVLATPRLCQGRLPPAPAPPGLGCPQLHQPAATDRRWWSLTPTRTISASRRTRRYPQVGFSVARRRTRARRPAGMAGRPGRAGVVVQRRDELAVPAQDRGGGDEQPAAAAGGE
jgi:hypothetical protein